MDPQAAAPSPQGLDRLSASALARVLGVHRNTVRSWVSAGCPHAIAARRERGAPWAFDLAAVVRWLQERASEQARAPLQRQIDRLEAALGIGADAGAITEAEARRRKRVAEARLLELELAERSGTLLRWDDVQPHWANLVLTAKEKLRALPAHARARIPGVTKQMAAGIAELVHEALTELASSDGTPPVPRKRGERREADAA